MDELEQIATILDGKTQRIKADYPWYMENLPEQKRGLVQRQLNGRLKEQAYVRRLLKDKDFRESQLRDLNSWKHKTEPMVTIDEVEMYCSPEQAKRMLEDTRKYLLGELQDARAMARLMDNLVLDGEAKQMARFHGKLFEIHVEQYPLERYTDARISLAGFGGGSMHISSSAKCHPDDVFDEVKGRKIAVKRLLRLIEQIETM